MQNKKLPVPLAIFIPLAILAAIAIFFTNIKCENYGCFERRTVDPQGSGYSEQCIRKNFKITGIPHFYCRLLDAHQNVIFEAEQKENLCVLTRAGFAKNYYVSTCDGAATKAFNLKTGAFTNDDSEIQKALAIYDEAMKAQEKK